MVKKKDKHKDENKQIKNKIIKKYKDKDKKSLKT